MTANSEQFKMKKSHYPYKFFIFSLHSRFALMIFLKIGHLLPNFLEFLFPIFKKKRGNRNNVYSTKNLCYKILLFLCVPVETFWCFLNVFTSVC